MITDFGVFLRKMRIEHGEILKDMADKLNVSAAYLSAVEVGKRNIPVHWVSEIARLYSLNDRQKEALKTAADNSAKSVTISFENASTPKKEAAILFAREFENIDAEKLEQIKRILNRSEE